jgi:hypothetical protein
MTSFRLNNNFFGSWPSGAYFLTALTLPLEPVPAPGNASVRQVSPLADLIILNWCSHCSSLDFGLPRAVLIGGDLNYSGVPSRRGSWNPPDQMVERQV